ncbi:MAG: DUF4287 domain-containing protein [Armatimonadetes bacterium]|nr:DUF4287 domain-containing protein [Armatimonadota bacterium]MBS1703269.1 DUF4287 domain-containing protein [Armatimonadota bacterium]
MDLNAAIQKQLDNIQKKTGKSLAELFDALSKTGLEKHGQLRDFAKTEFGLGHGDANALALHFLKKDETPAAGDVLDDIYTGAKAALRPIHEKLMATIDGFGEFEVHPKKGYVALRRKKQFAMIGPATNTRVEVGLNMKGVPGTERLVEQPAGGMCQYKVKVSDAGEVDDELFGWIKTAFESAG